VRELGVDEHRFARARFFRDTESGSWQRVEPWMTTFVNADTGQVLGIVDGRGSAGAQAWLEARSDAWRETVAIDPSAAFRAAIERALPQAKVSVDRWHLVRLANLTVTKVRQRVAREQLGHRGRKDDLAWAHRMLLLRAGDRLTQRARHRLDHVLAHDDPAGGIGAAWAVKERLRILLACTDLAAADTARGHLGRAVLGADTPETWRLWETVNAWWDEIETRVTNARTKAANTGIKQIKRTGRGYRNHGHYQTRILLHSARQTRRRRPLNQQATTFNCG
jgi:transposase